MMTPVQQRIDPDIVRITHEVRVPDKPPTPAEDYDSPRVLSVRVDTVDLNQAVSRIRTFLRERGLKVVATVNPEFIMTAYVDDTFLHILNHCDLNVIDGTGLQLALRLFHGKQCHRVTGVDLTWALADLAAREGYSLFLLGAAEGVARAAADRLQARFPALRIAGCYSGSPGEEGLVERINSSRADILLVAFGAPKQEKFIFANAHSLKAKVAMGVGGTFDYIGGVVPRAPQWMRRLGFEWLYRLFRQPQRLSRIAVAVFGFPLAVVIHEFRTMLTSLRIYVHESLVSQSADRSHEENESNSIDVR